jgi:hypothetical protein
VSRFVGRHGIQDRPDEAAELAGDGGDGDVSMLPLIESPEPSQKSMLGLDGDGNDFGWLALSASVEDEIGTSVVAVIPGSFHEEPTGVDVAGLGDGTATLSLPGRALHGDETEVGHESSGRAEAADVVDLGNESDGGQRLHAPKATESFDEEAIRG